MQLLNLNLTMCSFKRRKIQLDDFKQLCEKLMTLHATQGEILTDYAHDLYEFTESDELFDLARKAHEYCVYLADLQLSIYKFTDQLDDSSEAISKSVIDDVRYDEDSLFKHVNTFLEDDIATKVKFIQECNEYESALETAMAHSQQFTDALLSSENRSAFSHYIVKMTEYSRDVAHLFDEYLSAKEFILEILDDSYESAQDLVENFA